MKENKDKFKAKISPISISSSDDSDLLIEKDIDREMQLSPIESKFEYLNINFDERNLESLVKKEAPEKEKIQIHKISEKQLIPFSSYNVRPSSSNLANQPHFSMYPSIQHLFILIMVHI